MDEHASAHRPFAAPNPGLAVVLYGRRSVPGVAHFLDGIGGELERRGHRVNVAPPDASPESACQEADLVLVHDGLTPAQIQRIGQHRRRHGGYRLLFRHSALQGLDPMAFDLRGYDGVLAACRVIADICLAAGVVERAWIWLDAADTARFHPRPGKVIDGDAVFIGVWGNQTRNVELRQFLIEPVRLLGLRAHAYGPSFPAAAVAQLSEAGIAIAGWAAHEEMATILGRFRCTIHVPSRERSRLLPGLPSIRLFEAMSCGTPLVSAPWTDFDGLFSPGRDFLVARDAAEMRRHLRALIHDEALRGEIAGHARNTILTRHSSAHRVDQLMDICRELDICGALPPVWEPSREGPPL